MPGGMRNRRIPAVHGTTRRNIRNRRYNDQQSTIAALEHEHCSQPSSAMQENIEYLLHWLLFRLIGPSKQYLLNET